MKSLLVLAVIAAIIFFGVKNYYKPVSDDKIASESLAPTSAKPIEPPVLAKPTTPIVSPEEIQKIIALTKDMNASVRWQALKFLIQANAPEADGLVYDMLRQDPDTGLRKNIVLMLGERNGPKSSQYLIKALQDQETPVRIAALQMLDKIGDYSAGPAISELLRDSDDSVRLEAISTLNSLQAKQIAEIRRRQEEEARRQQKQLSNGGK